MYRSQLANQIYLQIQNKVREIELHILKLAQDRVPWDTEELKDTGIKASTREETNGFIITLEVLNTPHEDSKDTNLQIARKLEIGINLLTGMPLLRTQTSKGGENAARTPTAGWWTQFEKDVLEYLDKIKL